MLDVVLVYLVMLLCGGTLLCVVLTWIITMVSVRVSTICMCINR